MRAEGKQLQVDVKKEGDKAGDSFGKRMAAGFKKSWSGANIGKGLVQGLGLAGGLGAVGLLTGAISKVTDVLGDATQAAIAEEASIQKLGTALRANVPNWDGQTAAIEQVLKARMKLGFSDDEQRDSLAQIVVATKDVTKALEVQRTAMDLARLKGISLADASAALIKVEGGQFRALKALGIQLPKNATATQALAAVQKAAAGQAEDYADTNAGKLLVSQVKLDDVMETLGAVTMPLVVDVMTTAAEVATDLADAFTSVGDAAKNNDDPLQNIANLIHDLFKSPEDDARTFTGALFDGLNDMKSGLDDAAVSINDWWTFWDDHSSRADREAAKMADHTADAIEGMKSRAQPDLMGISATMDDVGDASGDMADDIATDNKKATKSWDDLRRDLISDAQDIIDDAFQPVIDADRLRATNAEIAAQREILASATATKEQKRDARDKLHELTKDNAEYLLKLAEAGETGSKAYAKGIRELRDSIKKAKGPAKAALQEVLDKILEVERAGKVVPINVIVAGQMSQWAKNLAGNMRAAGGPQQAGVPYVVGERGPEIHVPATSGRILSTAQSMAAVSGGAGGYTDASTNNVIVQGLLPVRTAGDVRREMQALSDIRRIRKAS